MDDDFDAGVMQMPDGTLYLSTAAKAGPEQTKTTVQYFQIYANLEISN